MPRVDDGGSRQGRGYRLPGVYRELTDWARAAAAEPDPRDIHRPGFDPRQPREPDPHSFVRPILNRLEAGEPATVPRWMIGGHSIPVPKDVPLFADRAIRRFTVHPDDTITASEDDGAEG
jgi:hypothetical protein